MQSLSLVAGKDLGCLRRTAGEVVDFWVLMVDGPFLGLEVCVELCGDLTGTGAFLTGFGDNTGEGTGEGAGEGPGEGSGVSESDSPLEDELDGYRPNFWDLFLPRPQE